MNRLYALSVLFVLIQMAMMQPVSAQNAEEHPVAIVIHGGAGTIVKEKMTPELEAEYKAILAKAARAGHRVLTDGGSSLEAVQAAVVLMEDSPLFNAGKGAVFSSKGTNELDASIMDGKTLNAGAVTGVSGIKNPIKLARAVMEESRHVMLSGEGAVEFARQQKLAMESEEYFYTPRRWIQFLEKFDGEADEKARLRAKLKQSAEYLIYPEVHKYGTVGAVALDARGNLAAATSTGGMTNKRFGRIGDSPVIGAGTYASNQSCAVSATGHGEYFIRNVVAYDICARVKYQNKSVTEAAQEVVLEHLKSQGGDGGVIAMDPEGNLAMVFNTPGMYRAAIDTKGKLTIGIYQENE